MSPKKKIKLQKKSTTFNRRKTIVIKDDLLLSLKKSKTKKTVSVSEISGLD